MQINLKNTYHNKFVSLTVRPLSESEYDSGKSGYYLSNHSADRLCNMYIRLSGHQTKRFFTETCGKSNCSCHKFELVGYPIDQQITQDKNGNINIMVLDMPCKHK